MNDMAVPLSRRGKNSLLILAIVAEIAVADGWASLDECLAENAPMVETYTRFAEAAMRVIKQRDKTETRH
jgi:hypothetical protein